MIKKYKHDNKTYYMIQLSHTDTKGKRHQPKFRFNKDGLRITSERSAKKLEFEYLQEFINELEGKLNDISFDKWHDKFLQDIKLHFKRGTVMQYDGDLRKWLPLNFGIKKLSDYSKADIHSLIFEYLPKHGATPNLQRKTRRVLARIFEAAIEEGLINRNPCKGIKVKVPPPQKQVLNHDEVVQFLSNAKEFNHSFYYLWSIALLTGLRNGEIYALCWKNVDLVSGLIHVNQQWTNKDGLHGTKSNRSRIVPVSNDLKSLLIELKNLGPFSETLTGLNGNNQKCDDLVLPRSSEWKHGEQAKITRLFCKSIGITEVKFHDLRATFITNALTNGATLPQVMSVVGHSRTSTTDEYLRLAGVNVKGVTEHVSYSLPEEKRDNLVSITSLG